MSLSTLTARPALELTDLLAPVLTATEEHRARTDTDAVFPHEALSELRRTGLLGLVVPREYGGLGGTVADVVTAGIALGRADMSVAMIFTMHCQQVAALVRFAGPTLRETLLPEIAAGTRYLASVTTEAKTGGHLLTSGSETGSVAGDLIIDRQAPIVTGGAVADGFLLTALRPEAQSPSEVSLVYAGREKLDIEESGDWQPLGMRASHSVALRLHGRVPADHVVGEPGGFHHIATSVFAPLAHLGWSASWLGTAAGALSRVLHLLRSPAGRRGTDMNSELLLTRLSRARQRLDTVHALLQATTATVANQTDLSASPIQLQLNALKITAAEQCYRTVEDLIEAVGLRHGYLRGSPVRLEQALRDLRSASLNYSNDRLHLADGRLALLDPEVRFV